MSEYVHKVGADEEARIASFLRWLAVGVVGFVVLIVVLFVTADHWLRLISIEAERRFIEPYIGLLNDSELIDGDPVLQAYVSGLVSDIDALLDHDGEPELRVFVIQSDTVNAFATLGGYIFVFDGLIGALENENSLAMVLAHEIAHVRHRDPLLSTGRGMLIQLAISSLSGSGMDPATVNVSSDVILNQYSREQELAADELALTLLQRRYRHVGGATRLFDIIDDDAVEDKLAEFLSTHPNTDARIERLESLTQANGWIVGEPAAYPENVQRVLAY